MIHIFYLHYLFTLLTFRLLKVNLAPQSSLNTTIFFNWSMSHLYIWIWLNIVWQVLYSLVVKFGEAQLSVQYYHTCEYLALKSFFVKISAKTKFYWESQPSYKICINSQFSNVSFSWAWRCTWQFLLSFVFPLTPVCKFSRLSGCGSLLSSYKKDQQIIRLLKENT